MSQLLGCILVWALVFGFGMQLQARQFFNTKLRFELTEQTIGDQPSTTIAGPIDYILDFSDDGLEVQVDEVKQHGVDVVLSETELTMGFESAALSQILVTLIEESNLSPQDRDRHLAAVLSRLNLTYSSLRPLQFINPADQGSELFYQLHSPYSNEIASSYHLKVSITPLTQRIVE